MSTIENSHKQMIATSSVLIGLTPIIPIPLLDDLAKSYFQRRMVRQLAAQYNIQLEKKDISALADDRSSGCIMGCLTMVLLYPIKKIFRKIFFFLEWKRAIDTVSYSYHQGYLIAYAFAQGWYQPNGRYSAEQLRAAIDDVCRQAGADPIAMAVRATFEQSKDLIKNAVEMLTRNLQRFRKKPDEAEVKQAAALLEEAETGTGVSTRLEHAIEEIPPGYFERLHALLHERLKSLPEK